MVQLKECTERRKARDHSSISIPNGSIKSVSPPIEPIALPKFQFLMVQLKVIDFVFIYIIG